MRLGVAAAGCTLVEVLVALTLLSVGLLGIATLCLESLQISQSALHRTQAVTLAADLADRIRANRAPANAYDCGDPCEAGAGGNAMAAADLAAWLADVPARLPGGSGAIVFTAAGPGSPARYTVTIRWNVVGDAALQTYALQVDT